jgi:hypothetical protein
MATRTLKVNIDGDSSGAEKALSKTEKAAGGFQNKMKSVSKSMLKFGGAMTLGVTLPVVAGFKMVTDAASDMGEATSKVRVIFGKNAKSITSWSTTTAKAMGISKVAALTFAGSLGNVFTQLGVNTKQAATMSKAWITLAGDLASFNNADPSEVLESMEAATRGEYDALQKYAPSVSAATIEQEAMRMSGKKLATELTAQEKLLALNKLIFEQTGAAQGDFARTADSAANKQKALNAQFEDAKAKLGDSLLPILTDLTDLLSKVVDKFTKLTPEQQKFILYAIAATAAIGPLTTALGGLGAALAFATGPIGLFVLAIAAVSYGLYYAYNNSETFRTKLQEVAGALPGIAVQFTQFGDTVGKALAGPLTVAARAWPEIERIIRAVLSTTLANVQNVFQMMIGAVSVPLNIIRGYVKLVTSLMRGDVSGAFGAIYQTASRVFNGVAQVITNAMALATRNFRAGIAAIKNAWNSTLGGRSISIPGFDPPGPGPSFGGASITIPRLHDGGVFHAPRAGGEGLALLKDGERVLTKQQQRNGGVTHNWYITGSGGEDIGRTIQQIVRYEAAFAGTTAGT